MRAWDVYEAFHNRNDLSNYVHFSFVLCFPFHDTFLAFLPS